MAMNNGTVFAYLLVPISISLWSGIMKLLKKIFISTFLFTVAGSAYATLLDFKADADVLEQGYLLLDNYIGLKITASGPDNDTNQYAYMDSSFGGTGVANGGLGACMDLKSNDHCTPSSDDNVTHGESVHFVWDSNIVITGIWFNNNHDSDFNLAGNKISIEGDDYLFSALDFDVLRSSGATLTDAVNNRNADFFYGLDRTVSMGSSFDISFFDDQFYISAIEYKAVPVPAAVWLFGSGLISLVGAARARRKA